METAAQTIRVSALLGGNPTTERGEEDLSRWEYNFQLEPVPEYEWQTCFTWALEQWSVKIKQIEDKEGPWELKLSPNRAGVVLGCCYHDEVKFLFSELKEIVRTANESCAKTFKRKKDSETQKLAILKEIEELKQTLDFDN